MKVLISDGLSKEGLKIFDREGIEYFLPLQKLSPQELGKVISRYSAIIVRSGTKLTKELIEKARNLKVIGRAGIGLDNIDVNSASKQGIVVMNSPGGNTISTAEHTVSMILALSRNIPQANSSIKNGRWDRKAFTGTELYNKVLGIIGLGRIGREVAFRLKSFGMKVVASDPFLPAEKAREVGVELLEFKKLLKVSDYITVHLPLTEGTRHLIAAKEFGLMKKGVRIINCARGGIVDEKALLKAIDSGRVTGAALDVFENEPPPAKSALLESERVIVTPHLGASTAEAQVNVSVDIAGAVSDALLGKGIKNAVNMPSVEPEILEELKPYIELSEGLGAFCAQIIKGQILSVKVEYSGDITKYQTVPLTVALIKGILKPVLGDEINYINAPFIAKERGIKVVESKSMSVEEYANLICVEVKGKDISVAMEGTLFTKSDPRIVRINGYHVDAVPSGYMVFIENRDLPGVVGQVGMIFGRNGINIAGMTFGRRKRGGKALSVLNVDGSVSDKVLKEIKRAKNILSARLVKI